MKKLKYLFLSLLMLGASCSKEDVPAETSEETPALTSEDLEVEEFIYAAMNDIYLYKADVPVLADSYFSTQKEKLEFLEAYESPESLYKDLQSSQDRFSFMTSDYEALRKLLDEGVKGTTGMDYALGVFTGTDNVFGFVRYVLPGSSADEAGVKRGDFFTEIDGQSMTRSNYQQLLGAASYSMRIAAIEDNTVKQTDKVVELVKEEIAENPVFVEKLIQQDGHTIGYLMYNGFTPDFDPQLNAAFGRFKAAGVTDLVLDLRYNGGGDVETAIDLAALITGQFHDQVFMKLKFNKEYQNYYEENVPHLLERRFNSKLRNGEDLQSLNLQKVYVIATESSASASELVIHGLRPFIDVVQVGTTTVGKFQASTTLYDSPDFNLTDDGGNVHANPDHKYAIQPLILKYANKNDESDFVDGLFPDVKVEENLNSLGVLGDPSETLLSAAIAQIVGEQQKMQLQHKEVPQLEFETIGESGIFQPNYQRMYIRDLKLLPRQ